MMEKGSLILSRGVIMAEWAVNPERVTIKMSDGSVFAGAVNIRNFQRLADFFRAADDQFVLLASEEGQPRSSHAEQELCHLG
jgi:hypothetical protein